MAKYLLLYAVIFSIFVSIITEITILVKRKKNDSYLSERSLEDVSKANRDFINANNISEELFYAVISLIASVLKIKNKDRIRYDDRLGKELLCYHKWLFDDWNYIAEDLNIYDATSLLDNPTIGAIVLLKNDEINSGKTK